MESILSELGNKIISELMVSYGKRDIANFVGIYLRLYT